jgi:ATP phosphoribosyltransferase regulatory subunit HisZ
LPANVQERVIFDLGLLRRELGYYTGAIFEVLDASVGVPLGGGGRYDELLGRFGRPLPAVGWMVEVERVHEALVKERS